jgi:hypothetical protein
VSVRSTAGFGGPALASFAVGDGLRIWLVAAAVAAVLVGAVLLLHAKRLVITKLQRIRDR